MGYTIDVYRGTINSEKHFGIFALYVSFFPQLVAGPIERASNLIPQFHKKHRHDFKQILSGLELIGWGLFKKVVIADWLGLYVNAVYNNVNNHSGLTYIIATYMFTIQIYCDFSGYSDIAIGAARVLGFKLMKNFNLPYFAPTIAEFWRRWHISLSTWFRDYLYIPLGGNRKGIKRTYVNLLIVMVLCGVWHGAAWTYIIWGTLHGVLLCISRLTLPTRNRIVDYLCLPTALVTVFRTVVTFNLVAFLWIFFRANTVQDAFHIITNLFDGWPKMFIDKLSMAHGVVGISVLLIVQLIQRKGSVQQWLEQCALPVRYAVYLSVLFAIILLGFDGQSQFIYFQF